jgi:acetyl esterase/lipase
MDIRMEQTHFDPRAPDLASKRWGLSVLGTLGLCVILSWGVAAQDVVLPLWEGDAPGALGSADEDRPTLTVYLPDSPGGTGVVVLPGGGYRHLAFDHEGHQVARWLNTLGIAAFVLKYRLGPTYRHPAPLLDAQRALRTVRARADEWGVDPSRIGILGFSAGGHLTTTTGTRFDDGIADDPDPVQRVSSRPDFMIPIYPVVSLFDPVAHAGSRVHLLGEEPDQKLVESLSNHLQVTAETPPTFLVHTTDDAAVPVENSLLFYASLRQAGVPVEMHLFETGRHGFGLAPDDPVLSAWPKLCEAWLRARGLIE